MKHLIGVIVGILFLSIHAKAQTYNIASSNGQTISTCSGTFYDSGGQYNDYISGETYTVTFCPSTAGASVTIDFTTWNVGSGDNLEIFDGANVSAPSYGIVNANLSPVGMVISASILNPSGCLTLKWTSASSAGGWAATIACGIPCQNYQVTLNSSVPPFHLDSGIYYIDICPGDTVSLEGAGLYALNDSVYHQSDATTSFRWDMGNHFLDTIQTIRTTYDTIKGYNVQLSALDSNGCLASQTPKIRVRLSTRPDFDGSHPNREKICEGDTTTLYGIATTKTWKANSALSLAGTTYLPDGSGASYSSSLVFNSFRAGQVLQSGNDIVAVKATMEHSYLGDLHITVTCPSGQTAVLKSYPGGGSTFLGEPIDNNAAQVPGIGYQYAWKPTGTTTMLNATGYNHTFTDVLGTVYTNHSYIPPSTAYPVNGTALPPFPIVNYLPETNFSALIGCPLNGAWSITVTDNLFIDNGFIFSWGIEFAQRVLPVSWSYKPFVQSQLWNAAPSIIANAGSNITILPSDSGQYTYTYTVIDNFGCAYDTSMSVNVIPTPITDIGSDTIICGFGVVTFDATTTLPGTNYNWNTGNLTPIQQTNMSGNYVVTVSHTDGNLTCSSSDSAQVDQYPLAKVNLGNDTCVMTDYTLHAGNIGSNPPFLYLWSDGSTNESLDVLQSGTYSVTVAADMNSPCIEEDEIVVTKYAPGFLGIDKEFCSFMEITYEVPDDGSVLLHNYLWTLDGIPTTNSSSPNYVEQYLPFGQHILKVEVDNGCYDEVNITSLDCMLEFPNIITPNNDGYNDKFVVKGLEHFLHVELVIYNRWGTKIYESSNYQNNWDGEGRSDGVYYYVLRTTVGQQAEYTGTITILQK